MYNALHDDHKHFLFHLLMYVVQDFPLKSIVSFNANKLLLC